MDQGDAWQVLHGVDGISGTISEDAASGAIFGSYDNEDITLGSWSASKSES